MTGSTAYPSCPVLAACILGDPKTSGDLCIRWWLESGRYFETLASDHMQCLKMDQRECGAVTQNHLQASELRVVCVPLDRHSRSLLGGGVDNASALLMVSSLLQMHLSSKETADSNQPQPAFYLWETCWKENCLTIGVGGTLSRVS